MKKGFFIFIAIVNFLYCVQAQENQVFYYHNDEKIYLDKIENTKVIHFKNTIDSSQKNYIYNYLKTSGYKIVEITPVICKISGNMVQFKEDTIISTAEKNGNIQFISDMLMYKDSTKQWLSNEMFIKIHAASNLYNILQNSKIPFVSFKQFGSDKQTYLVELNVTENSALEYANNLSKIKEIVWAQPSFWRLIRPQNPYYASQWGLSNTGQYNGIQGIDINVTPAWNIATGTGIKVAVIDGGVDLNHPDLVNNLLPGYDATDPINGGSHGGIGDPGCYGGDAHGTACSGIIAAEDNEIGVKGVAYNAKIIPVRIAQHFGIYIDDDCWINSPSNDTWVADGIYKAWHDYGADILSISQAWGSDWKATEAEINAALTQGRSSLGCVVVSSAGNYDSEVIFPANFLNVIAVGAISPCGKRKTPASCDTETSWYSCYGTNLDIMAPGALIPTTDLHGSLGYNPLVPIHPLCGGSLLNNDYSDEDYTVWFNGTSAACPHVAGVAALVFSVNPNLTGQEVRDILASTAQKVRPDLYNYSITSGHPNGTWHEEMGYGLVDAHAAVLAAKCAKDLPNVQGIITQNSTWNTPALAIDNIIVPNGITLTITSNLKCQKNVSIIIESRGKLIIDGGTLTNGCYGGMWQGITISGDVNPFSTYNVEIYGGRIENAICAIHSVSGGSIYTNNAVFENNLTAIQMDPSVPTQANANVHYNTQFIVNESLIGNPLDFENHIKLTGSDGIALWGCTFRNDATLKSSTGNNGIVAFNSPITLKEYCPCQQYNQTTGICITSCMKRNSFSGFNKAISASNAGVTPTLKIRCSDFVDNLYGIYINGINNHELILNNFDLKQAKAVGVSISNATGYRIEENSFTNSYTGPRDQTVGLTITNSGAAENEVYNNIYKNLYTGQNFVCNNGSVLGSLQFTGLQTLCNNFTNNRYRDVHIGGIKCLGGHNIRKEQGSLQKSAGNKFYGVPLINIDNTQSQISMNYYHGSASNEYPATVANVTHILANSNTCPSKIGNLGGANTKGDNNLTQYLAQYDEWNAQYEYWLARAKEVCGEDEMMRRLDDEMIKGETGDGECTMILDKVSYFSALKDNYFNAIIVLAFDDELMNEGSPKSPSNFEGVPVVTERSRSEGRGSLYEKLRFLFNYRGQYVDYLSIAETYLAENNYPEALTTLALMFEKFKLSEEQRAEINGLKTYAHCLQQLENEQNSIYTLSEEKLNYLTNYVETNTGRGVVFAKNILCELYGICLEEGGVGYGVSGMRYEVSGDENLRESVYFDKLNNTSASSACQNTALENIKIYPNPVNDILTISGINPQQITVYNVFGEKIIITPVSSNKINMSHLPNGLYFLHIFTDSGDFYVGKVLKISL